MAEIVEADGSEILAFGDLNERARERHRPDRRPIAAIADEAEIWPLLAEEEPSL